VSKLNRRRWLENLGTAAIASALPSPAFSAQLKSPDGAGKGKLDLSDLRPKSMLHVPETTVEKSRYPVIDIHTHMSIRAEDVNGVGIGEKMDFLATPEALLPVMDRRNIKILVNLTGGSGKGLEETIRRFDQTGPTHLNRSTATNSTRSTIASSKPKTNTSITLQLRFRPRVGGEFTESACLTTSSRRFTTRTPNGS